METLGFSEKDISYVFLTHDHFDHYKNIHTFDTNKIYSGKGNIKDLAADHELKAYQHYQFGELDVMPLKISHDATNPLAFLIKGKESLLYMTDTGFVSRKNRDLIHDLNYYIIEANHDVQMLMKTRRPLFLKNRILGDTGHLNNEDSARVMCEVIGQDTKEIALAHLSQEANSKDVALKTYYSIFDENHIKFSHDHIKVADQVNIISGGEHEN
jgi:phosphoribosyl 1,2-cyclic phosphodiesterase